jgi:transposase
VSIVGGLDMHRKQITFDYLDTMTGALRRGKITPADRPTLREWLGRFADDPESVRLVVEGCTGWRYVVEECRQAGIDIHVAEPADTASARGPKRHAKTDKLDAKHLRELLVQGRIPESWIPPEQVLEMRAKVRLYKDLRDERTGWIQRIRATLYHQGVPALPGGVLAASNRATLEAGAGRSPTGAQAVAVALRQIDRLDAEIDALLAEIRSFAAIQPGCKALQRQYGIGKVTAVIIWAELGDTRRFSASRHAVRHTGLDISVYASDGKRTRGHLARQGPPLLRWALFEADRVGSQAHLPRPRLLPPGRRARRRQPRHAVGGPQAGPARSPHPARAR